MSVLADICLLDFFLGFFWGVLWIFLFVLFCFGFVFSFGFFGGFFFFFVCCANFSHKRQRKALSLLLGLKNTILLVIYLFSVLCCVPECFAEQFKCKYISILQDVLSIVPWSDLFWIVYNVASFNCELGNSSWPN